MANTDPVADTAGVVEQVWRLGRAGRPLRRAPGRRGHRRPGRRAARRARRDGRLRGPGPGVLRRRPLRDRRGADAPGAGVRQGVRRRHRPARPGAAADRGRADERGRACPARLGLHRLAGGRRGGDHRPRRACSPGTSARGCTSATCPPPGSVEIIRWAKAQGLATSPPRSPRTTCCSPTSWPRSYDPVYKVNPPLRTAADVAALRDGPGRRHHRRRRHRPRAAPGGGQGLRVGRGRVRHARAGDRARRGAAGDGRHRPAGLGRRRRPDVGRGPPRIGRLRRPRPAARRRRAGQPDPLRPGRAAGWSTRPRSPPAAATPRSPAWSCPAGWSPRSCAARPTVLDGKLA